MSGGDNTSYGTGSAEDQDYWGFNSWICILINLEHKLIKGPLFRGLLLFQKKKYQQNHGS